MSLAQIRSHIIARQRGHCRAFGLIALLAALYAWPGKALAQLPCGYEVVAVIQAPAGPFHSSPTVPLSISPDGRYVVGYYNFDAVAQARGWYYEMPNGPFTALPHPPGMFTSYAEDVNNAGQICGKIAGTSGDFGFVFDLHTGVYTLLPPSNPGGTCSANSINASGTVCGTRSMAGGPEPTYPTTGFVWSPATGFQDVGLIDGLSTGLNAIADDGQVAGWRGAACYVAGAQGIVGQPSSLVMVPLIPGGTTSACFDINNGGLACGSGVLPSPLPGDDVRAFQWLNGRMEVLAILPQYRRAFANAVNDSGVIVGSCKTVVSGQGDFFRALIWQDGDMRDLTALVASPTATLVNSASGVSETGVVVANGYFGSIGPGTLVLSPVGFGPGDVTRDCVTNISDLLLVILTWGSANQDADANGDGVVDVGDLLIVVSNWSN